MKLDLRVCERNQTELGLLEPTVPTEDSEDACPPPGEGRAPAVLSIRPPGRPRARAQRGLMINGWCWNARAEGRRGGSSRAAQAPGQAPLPSQRLCCRVWNTRYSETKGV